VECSNLRVELKSEKGQNPKKKRNRIKTKDGNWGARIHADDATLNRASRTRARQCGRGTLKVKKSTCKEGRGTTPIKKETWGRSRGAVNEKWLVCRQGPLKPIARREVEKRGNTS